MRDRWKPAGDGGGVALLGGLAAGGVAPAEAVEDNRLRGK